MPARVVKGTAVQMPGLAQLQRDLAGFNASVRRKYMKAAFNATAKVGVKALKQTTPRGPTGNLRKSIAAKATQNYGLAGYRKGARRADANSDTAKGYHQHFLEFGTKPRTTKGPIASTFNSKAKGRGGARQIPSVRGGVRLVPRADYPRSFFKRAKAGQKVDLKAMPVGGRTGKPPIATAFNQAKGQMASTMTQQSSTALERVLRDIARKSPPRAT